MTVDTATLVEALEVGYLGAPVAENSKAGLGKWNERDYDIEELLWHLRQRHNVALKMGRSRGPSRPCVIDIDSRSSRLRKLARDMGFRSDMEIITASGKRHIYGLVPVTITDLRSRLHALDRAWDAKLTGIVLFPPSRIDEGEYRIPRGKWVVPPSDLPVFHRLTELIREVRRAPPSPADLPEEARLAGMRSWIRKVRSVQGDSGDRNCFRVAMKVVSVCPEFPLALAEMLAWNNECADPPWSERELEHKVRCALKYTYGS